MELEGYKSPEQRIAEFLNNSYKNGQSYLATKTPMTVIAEALFTEEQLADTTKTFMEKLADGIESGAIAVEKRGGHQ